MEKLQLRVGCDLVNISRFKEVLNRTPVAREKMFLSTELVITDPVRLAGIFAAKEATLKALGLGAGAWHDIMVSHRKDGKPTLSILTNSATKIESHDLSITHDGDYALAFVCFMVND